jgi:bifunctional enzyme CysN/CysC
MHTPIIRLVTCGSVDDGKSTLIGRLLVETNSVPQDTIEQARTVRRTGSTVDAGEIDFSLLTDGLEAEREQGITIDVAYRSMNLLSGRRLIIADAPGHEQYTRNMVVAASRSDIALILVDATRGVREQTLRHLTVVALSGIKTVLLAVNKLDAVNYSQAEFEKISQEVNAAANRLDIKEFISIPVSALAGANVSSISENTPWYKGVSVLEFLSNWEPPKLNSSARMSVQLVARSENYRGVAGFVTDGSFKVGDEVTIAPQGLTATIKEISLYEKKLNSANENQSVTMVLSPERDVSRGDVILAKASPVKPADRFAVNLVWLAEEPLAHGRSYLLINGPTTTTATVTVLRHRLDVNTGQSQPARTLQINEIGSAEIATDNPLNLDLYQNSRSGGNFILVDRVSFQTVAAGMVQKTLRRAFNITHHDFEINKNIRAKQKQQRPQVVWLTGLSGSGKSTIANAVEKHLHTLGLHTYVLDGDNLRLGINKDLGFTKEDRAENVRRVGEVAKLMVDAGLVVLVALVSPFKSDRDSVRTLFESDEFKEVWIATDPAVCSQRDPKGLYAKAKAGELPNLTGVGQEYEPPTNAELILDGALELDESVQKLVDLIIK